MNLRDPDPNRHLAQIEAEATQWFFDRDAGADSQQTDAFQRWLQADPAHGRIFAEIERTWGRLGDAREHVRAAIPITTASRWSQRRRGWAGTVLAAAAALAVVLAWQTDDGANRGGETIVAHSLRLIDLPDGSVATLNKDAAVEVQFGRADRRLRLVRGEAHFRVAHDPTKPFIVTTGGLAIKAVGTAFNVRVRPEAIEVLVTDGKIRVDDAVTEATLLGAASRDRADAPDMMVAGQKVRIENDGARLKPAAAIATLSASDMERELSWLTRRLNYTDTTLAEIVADFNRHNRHRLVIDDPALAARRFGGSFPAGDYDSFVRVLEATFAVRAERGHDQTILRQR